MLKVVVVEDEELVRKGIVLTVDWAGAGCAVVGEAANGEEGLEVIRASEIRCSAAASAAFWTWAIFSVATQPLGARLPQRIWRPPVGL